ncbi:MAG: hypothetical protein J0M17_24050, partial [Planctomycetes bacterium]|nr:hypothetical protein [Planctomycetota bacterium]
TVAHPHFLRRPTQKMPPSHSGRGRSLQRYKNCQIAKEPTPHFQHFWPKFKSLFGHLAGSESE